MNAGAVKVALHRLRRRFGELLRREVGHTVADAAALDEEIRYLFSALSRMTRWDLRHKILEKCVTCASGCFRNSHTIGGMIASKKCPTCGATFSWTLLLDIAYDVW